MAEVIGASLYKLVNAMAGNEVTNAEAKEATAGKTYGEVSDALTGAINDGTLPIGEDLPEIEAGDAGKVLAVNEAETGVEWVEAGNGGYDPNDGNKPTVFVTTAEFATLLGGTKLTLTATNYDGTKFTPYMTLGVDLTTGIILYAGSFMAEDLSNRTSVFSNTFYNPLASKAYCITAVLVSTENQTFDVTATEI